MEPKGLPTPQTKLINKTQMHIRKKTSLIDLYRRTFYLSIPNDYPKGKNQSYPWPRRDTGSLYGAEQAFLSSILCTHLSHISSPMSASFIWARFATCWSACNPAGFCQHWVFPCYCFLWKHLSFLSCLFSKPFPPRSAFSHSYHIAHLRVPRQFKTLLILSFHCVRV